MPSTIQAIHKVNGTFLGGYSGWDDDKLWTTVISQFLAGYGHFAANNSAYSFDIYGSPYMALIDKSTMEIVSTDAMSLINDPNGTVAKCAAMNTAK